MGPGLGPWRPRLTMSEIAAHEAFVAEELKGDVLWLALDRE